MFVVCIAIGSKFHTLVATERNDHRIAIVLDFGSISRRGPLRSYFDWHILKSSLIDCGLEWVIHFFKVQRMVTMRLSFKVCTPLSVPEIFGARVRRARDWKLSSFIKSVSYSGVRSELQYSKCGRTYDLYSAVDIFGVKICLNWRSWARHTFDFSKVNSS